MLNGKCNDSGRLTHLLHDQDGNVLSASPNLKNLADSTKSALDKLSHRRFQAQVLKAFGGGNIDEGSISPEFLLPGMSKQELAKFRQEELTADALRQQ